MATISIREISMKYEIDPKTLESHLNWIKTGYEKRKKEVENWKSPSEYIEVYRQIDKHARILRNLLENEVNSGIHQAFDQKTVRYTWTDTGKDIPMGFGRERVARLDTHPIEYREVHFTEGLIERLNSLSNVVQGLGYSSNPKKNFHRNLLVKLLKSFWEEQKKEKAKYSKAHDGFLNFMKDACNYMEIDPAGLDSLFKKIQYPNSA